VESRREVSQVGERVNASRGQTLLHFAESSKGEWTDKIFGGDFTKFRGSLDLKEVQEGYSVSVEEVRSSGGAESSIPSHRDCQIYT
jgi:hypothetical protein